MKRRRAWRVLAWLGAALLAACAGVGGWALFWTYYNPRVPLREPIVVTRPHGPGEVTLVLGGDLGPMDAALPTLERYGYDYPYQGTAELLRGADVAFANLESPVTGSTDRFPLWKKYVYKVAPEATASWQRLGLDLVSLANNHISDYRDGGVLDTVRHLDDAGLLHVGAGADESSARRPVIFDLGGTRIGFLAYLEDKPIYNLYLRTFAVGGRIGCAKLDRRDVAEDVARLRPLVDVLIVSVHWGENYKPPTKKQHEWAEYLASLGVDVVAGHHPHDVQPVEVIGKTVVIYSLGNYAWGAPGWPQLRIGFLARLRVAEHRLAAVELVPIVTQNRIVHFQPRRLAHGEDGWMRPFLDGSGDAVTWDGDVARVVLPQ